MKLGNLIQGNVLVLTQRTHGVNQNNHALDISSRFGAGIAPAEGRFLSEYKGSGATDDDDAFLWGKPEDGWVIQFTHSRCINRGNVTRGTRLFDTTTNHYHIALMENPKAWAGGLPKGGTWRVIIDYMDRSLGLGWLTPSGKHPVWTSWGTYTDRHLRPLAKVVEYEMVGLQFPVKCVTTNTTDMNVRKEPSTKSESIRKVAPNTPFETRTLSSGEAIDGVSTWYFMGDGWVSGRYVNQIPSTNNEQLEKDLVETKAQVTTLNQERQVLETKNLALVTEIDLLKPIVEALKLVNNTK